MVQGQEGKVEQVQRNPIVVGEELEVAWIGNLLIISITIWDIECQIHVLIFIASEVVDFGC